VTGPADDTMDDRESDPACHRHRPNLEEPVRSSRTSLIVAFVLVVAIAALTTGCSRSKATSGGGLSPADKTSSTATASADASDAAAVKNSDGTAAPASTGNATSGGSGSSTANGSSGTGTGSTATKPGTAAKPAAGMKVRILFWNDTSSKSLKGTEILVGSSAYKPKTTAKTDRLTTATVAYGKVLQLTVYPDGRGGKKIIVPMMVTNDMVPNSDQDAIHIAISDGSVRILGNPINDVDKTIPRF